MKHTLTLLTALLLTPLAALHAADVQTGNAQKIYVAVNGDDNASGSINSPLLTPDGARLKVKALKAANPTSPITVFFRAGDYPIPKELFKPGKNLIQVQLHDINDSGGICKGPFCIIFEDPEITQKRKLADRPYLYDVGRKDDPYWHHGF